MHNFADDNSLSAWGEILSKLIGTLESVDWFTKNEMIINPDKFQAIILDKKKSNLTNTLLTEAVVRRCSVKKVFLEMSQNSQKNTCARVSFLIKLLASCNFIKKETLAQVFSCEFCGVSKHTFFQFLRTPLVAASALTIDNQTIKSVSSVELLGIHLDDKLYFNLHISNICRSAANQLNTLI